MVPWLNSDCYSCMWKEPKDDGTNHPSNVCFCLIWTVFISKKSFYLLCVVCHELVVSPFQSTSEMLLPAPQAVAEQLSVLGETAAERTDWLGRDWCSHKW